MKAKDSQDTNQSSADVGSSASRKKADMKIELITLGDTAVGKTCLL